MVTATNETVTMRCPTDVFITPLATKVSTASYKYQVNHYETNLRVQYRPERMAEIHCEEKMEVANELA